MIKLDPSLMWISACLLFKSVILITILYYIYCIIAMDVIFIVVCCCKCVEQYIWGHNVIVHLIAWYINDQSHY